MSDYIYLYSCYWLNEQTVRIFNRFFAANKLLYRQEWFKLYLYKFCRSIYFEGNVNIDSLEILLKAAKISWQKYCEVLHSFISSKIILKAPTDFWSHVWGQTNFSLRSKTDQLVCHIEMQRNIFPDVQIFNLIFISITNCLIKRLDRLWKLPR